MAVPSPELLRLVYYKLLFASHLLMGMSTDPIGQFKAAMTYAEESLAIRQKLNDPRGLAMGLFGVGKVHMIVDDYARAETLFNEALLLLQGEVDPMVAGYIHLGGAMNAFLQGDSASMRELLQVCEIQFTQMQKQSALVEVNLLRILAFLIDGALVDAAESLLQQLTAIDDNQPVSTEILTVCTLVLHNAGQSDCAPDVLAFLRQQPSDDPFYREKLLPSTLRQAPDALQDIGASTTLDLAKLRNCLRTIVINPE